MRRAKIVATIGPAISSPEKIAEAIKAGMNVSRLNMSHGDHDVHTNSYTTIREQSAALGKEVAILADLQGPKIRLERFVNGEEYLKPGADFTITSEDVEGTKDICGTTYKGLPGDVKPGDKLLLDDGKIQLEAVEVTPTRVRTRVIVGGPISNNKGINLPGAAVSLPALTEKDEADLRFALNLGVDIIALSFVRSGKDVNRVHEIMAEEGIRIPVIAKIEKPQAVDNLQDIIDKFDGIMVARGDLGVELPFSEVPLVQKKAIEMARRWAKPVIVATQVLESMISSPTPTRAEVDYISTFTQTGDSARRLARLRPAQPVLAFTPNPKVRAFISLLWGVEAAHAPVATNIDGTTDIVNDYLVEHKLAEPGDLIVIAAGSPPGVAGSTNMVKVHRIKEQGSGEHEPEEREHLRPYGEDEHK